MSILRLFIFCTLIFASPLQAQTILGTPPISESAVSGADPAGESSQYNFGREFLNMILNLGLIIAIVIAATWAVKRMSKTRLSKANHASIIKILEKRALTPKSAIYLVEIGGKTIVVGESTAGLHALAELEGIKIADDTLETNSETASFPLSFSQILKKITPPSKS